MSTIFLPMSAAMSKLFNERGHFTLILKWLYQGFKMSVTKFDWSFAVKLQQIIALLMTRFNSNCEPTICNKMSLKLALKLTNA